MAPKIEVEITVHIYHHHPPAPSRQPAPRRPYSSRPAPAAVQNPSAAVLETIKEMGDSPGSCRTWARNRFIASGLIVRSGRGNIGHPYVVVHPQTRVAYRIPVYASVTLKDAGQVGYSIGGLDREEFEWYGFVAQPFGRMYLRRRTEIIAGIHRKKAVLGRACLSFSIGPEEDLYENRIHELLGDSTVNSEEL